MGMLERDSDGVPVEGPPITREMQLLFGAYGQGRLVGVVQMREGLLVTYDNGVQLTFVPVPTGGKLGGFGE
jgi:hypothetical protein